MAHIFVTSSLVIALAYSQAVLAHDVGGQTSTTYSEARHQAHPAAEKALAQVRSSVNAIEQMLNDGQYDSIHAEIQKAQVSVESIVDKVAVTGGIGTPLNASVQQLAEKLAKLHEGSNVAARLEDVKKALRLVEDKMK